MYAGCLYWVCSRPLSSCACSSELRRLVTLSRHGSRAPNDVIHRICPANEGNMAKYNVPLEQLTEFGMYQLLAAGKEVRKVYVEQEQFLAPTLDGVNHTHLETYFRADAATRCAQSAATLGYGLYPDGTGPSAFPHQPVPVTMQLLPNEHDFAAPKGPCKATLKADLAVYSQTRGVELVNQYKDVLDQVSNICGVDLASAPTMPGGEELLLAIKDIADMFIFDRDQGLEPVAGLTPEVSGRLEQLAFTNLMERYYSTDREITYWTGGFANLLLGNLNSAANPESPSVEQYRYYSYHGHRELLHGLGKMLGWDFHFEGLPEAMNTTALQPGATMFFELRATKTEAGEDYFVRTFIWSPKTEREQIKLDKCSTMDCSLAEFNSIISSHVAKTGTWQEICNYEPTSATFAQAVDQHQDSSSDAASLIVLGAVLGACLVFAIHKAVVAMRTVNREGYIAI